jgi:hypothetical protein
MPHGNVWVYNFHYYDTNLDISDIIKTENFYRLVKIACILLHERNLLKDGELRVEEE